MKKAIFLATSAVAGLAMLAGLSPTFAQTAAAPAANPVDKVTPVTDDTLLNPPDGDWLMYRRTYNGWGYSPLKQITKDNVKNLGVAWTWALSPGATETTPIVHDGILYIFNNGDKVQALDGATGNLIWQYIRTLPAPLAASTGNSTAKRNMAIYGNDLIVATSDVHVIALNLKTGQVDWDKQVADWSKGYQYSGGPLVADGKIFQGTTGCGNAEPGGCFITALSPKDGSQLWRFNTIAQSGPESDTWNGIPVQDRHGASVWITGSYDPDQKTLFYGVAQPYPWIAYINGLLPAKEGGANNALYTDSTLALDPETGKLKWYHQYLPTDTWDLDYIYERILVDLPVNGTVTKQVVTTGKLGIIESLNRTDGTWLWAKQTVPQNVVQAIDPKTGAKTINQQAIPKIGQTTVNCPADPGGRGWPATAYDPDNQTLYLPLNEFCSNTTPQPLDQGQIYTGGGRATFARVKVPNTDGNVGRVDAIKLTDQSTVWSHREPGPVTSAMLPTAGGLVFNGNWDRYFRAFDADTGKILWQVRTSNAVNSFPISYSVNGKQYVAVAVGNGSSQATSLATLTPEFQVPQSGSSLWVFALPDSDAVASK